MSTEDRDVPGFPGYRVSSDGTVWSSLMKTGGIGTTWKQLVPVTDPLGYQRLCLSRDGRQFNRSVHRIVLEAFVGPRPEGMQGAHGNGNPSDNRLDNLRWDTPKANQADRWKHGTHTHGEQTVTAKLRDADIPAIRARLAAGEPARPIAADYGVSRSAIAAINSGKSWRHTS